MGGGLSSVSEELHSANDLSNGEESKNLSGNNGCGSNLGAVGVADGSEWVWANDGLWVLDELGVEVLESGHWSGRKLAAACNPIHTNIPRTTSVCNLRWAHLLSLGNELGKLKTDARIVDGWWDLA